MSACPCASQNYNDSVALSSLLRHLAPLVPEIPHSMALDMIRQRYIEFARKSKLLVAGILTDYQAGVTDYQLVPPKGYDIFSVLGLETSQNTWYPTWTAYPSSPSTHFSVVDNNVIRLANTPTVDKECGIVSYVTLIPTDCAEGIPQSIAGPYGRGIAFGAVADALNIPNKQWTNPALARVYDRKFEIAADSARSLATSNRKVDSTSFKPVRVI